MHTMVMITVAIYVHHMHVAFLGGGPSYQHYLLILYSFWRGRWLSLAAVSVTLVLWSPYTFIERWTHSPNRGPILLVK